MDGRGRAGHRVQLHQPDRQPRAIYWLQGVLPVQAVMDDEPHLSFTLHDGSADLATASIQLTLELSTFLSYPIEA